MLSSWTQWSRRRTSLLVVAALLCLAAAGGWNSIRQGSLDSRAAAGIHDQVSPVVPVSKEPGPPSETFDFPQESWKAASLELQSVQSGRFAQSVQLTGKIALNEDRVAHIFPLVEGRVDEVKVQLGNRVKKGDLMVVVQSKEVGHAMLQLFEDRHQREFAVLKDRWTQEVSANTLAMIKAIREGSTIDEIEAKLLNRPMGEYRDKLMTAYIGLYKSRIQLERLAPLSSGAVPGKQILEAEAERNASRATLQSLVEQIQQDAQQAAIISTHSVKEMQTRVSVDETNLKILGFNQEELVSIDPATQGESVSHYPIKAPFDGTVISKDVVLMERVGPQNQILSVADLSSVWVNTDIYEEHLPLLEQLQDQVIHLRSSAWPGRTFEARIFYTGDLVDESSRTISMRAVADNREGMLKPGMFVDVEFPKLEQAEVLQVPLTAVHEHEGKTFVFVHQKLDQFERRDVALGRRNSKAVEIRAGLRQGESIVSQGGFALKSRMLSELLSE